MNISYVDKDGKKTVIKGKVGDNILYLAHRFGIEMEGNFDFELYFYSILTCAIYFCKNFRCL